MLSESRLARSCPPEARFGWWQASDGQRLRRMDWLQPDPSKARGSLLFAGGRSDFIEKYLEAYDHWHRAGWNITAFDWRGQGGSRGDRAPENPEDFQILVDDMAAFIADWTEAPEATGPLLALGHSLGGHLLLRTLVEHRPKLDGAVLIAPMIAVNSAPVPDWLAPDFAEFMCLFGLRRQPMWRTPKALNRPGSQRQSLLTSCRERYEDELHWWERHPDYRLGAPSWGWMRAAYRSAATWFTEETLGQLDLPVLIVGTRGDRLVSANAIERIARQLPRAELLMFPDCAHEILREADPVRNEALDRIDRFLAERSP